VGDFHHQWVIDFPWVSGWRG